MLARTLRLLPLLRSPLHPSYRAMSSTPYKTVSTSDAPSAIGPYSQATVHNGVAYISGCIPFDPATMTLVDGGIEAQTQQALKNLFAVVKAAGSEPSVSHPPHPPSPPSHSLTQRLSWLGHSTCSRPPCS